MKVTCPNCGALTSKHDNVCEICGLSVVLTDFSSPTVQSTAPGVMTELSGTSTKQQETEDETAIATVTQVSTRLPHESPIQASILFPTLLITGHPTTIQLAVRNVSSQPIKNLQVQVYARGLSGVSTVQLDFLGPQHSATLTLNISPERAGKFLLWCEVDLRLRDVHQHLVGRRPLRINASAAMDAPAPNLRDIYTNLDAFEAESGLGESSFAKIAGNMTFRSMSELAAYRLPDRPQMFPLQEEWHLNQAVMATLGVSQSKKLIIPKPFRRYSQPGTLLRLTPKSEGTIKPVHFIASPEYTIGRSRKRATLVTWFYPLTPHNEDKTQHLSKVHVVARHENGGIFLTDAGSRCGTTLDAGPMTPFEPVPLKARTFLGLADEYFLDVHPVETSCPGGPEIVNISLWNGPDAPAPDLTGAVTFKPLDMEVALNEAVWLFTDANFGKSTRNPWTLNVEGVELVQGRIHHFRGCFWLESLVSNYAIHVNSHPVGAREIVPLMDGLDLKIGSLSFQVDVILEEPSVGTIDS